MIAILFGLGCAFVAFWVVGIWLSYDAPFETTDNRLVTSAAEASLLAFVCGTAGYLVGAA